MPSTKWVGACADRFREVDWSATGLGRIDDWPETLRSTVDMVLCSAAPKLLVWGSELVIFFNDAWMELVGSGPDRIGRRFPEFAPGPGGRLPDKFSTAFQGESCSDEIVLVANGLDLVRCTLSYTPVQTGSGRTAGVLVEHLNTTASYRAEASLHVENSRLSKLFAEAPFFIALMAGPELRLEFANRAFKELFSGRDLLGVPIRQVIPEAAGLVLADVLDHAFVSGTRRVLSDFQLSTRDADGRPFVRYLDATCQPVRDENDHVLGVLLSGHDATSRNKAQIEIERARHQSLHASRVNAMGTMAMTLAHELNQPLAAVNNYIATARRLLARGAHGSEALLASAQEEIARAGDVIRRARSMVRLGLAERSSVSIERAYHRTVNLLDASDDSDVKLSLSVAENATHVMADEVQLEQVFVNLIRNAMEATRSSDRREVIISSSCLDDRRVRITVRDFGRGFPPDVMKDVFERAGHSYGDGLGVGLALTRTIVEANGGAICLSNSAEGGAIVIVELDAPEVSK